jgi:hypothetical protein
MVRVLAVMAITAGIALANGDAAAHSFKVGAMIPLSGPSAETGRQWLDGFLLATREQDAHPDQHSDGHLGGLDVYVLTVDSAGDASAIKNLVAADNPEVLTGPAPAALLAEISKTLIHLQIRAIRKPWTVDRFRPPSRQTTTMNLPAPRSRATVWRDESLKSYARPGGIFLTSRPCRPPLKRPAHSNPNSQ